jgi:NADH-quinone oxidoreductase subunit C
MSTSPVIETLAALLPDVPLELVPSVDMPTIVVGRTHLLDVARVLRDHADLQFSLLVEVTAADYLPAEPRFEVVYHLVCLGEAFAQPAGAAPARRLRVKVRLPGADPQVPSVTGLWPGANWPEREVFDLFGIRFEQHPDLRRVLMPADWEGHPLRKDYPVQINRATPSGSALELTVEQFAANMKASRDRAARAAETRPSERQDD